jgi:hypothetical protein
MIDLPYMRTLLNQVDLLHGFDSVTYRFVPKVIGLALLKLEKNGSEVSFARFSELYT